MQFFPYVNTDLELITLCFNLQYTLLISGKPLIYKESVVDKIYLFIWYNLEFSFLKIPVSLKFYRQLRFYLFFYDRII